MSKRRYDETQPEQAEGAGASAADGLPEIRVLISNYEGSVIIGKAGDNVKAIRQATSCFLSVKRAPVQNVKDRILTVKGLPENIARALAMISQLLLEANNQRKAGAEPETTLTIKILIHKFVAGCILGKGGGIVKEIQETNKVRVALSSDVLPGSTEKTISVTGTPEALQLACERIVTQMATNPLRPGSAIIPYVPGAMPAYAPVAGFPAPGLPAGVPGVPAGSVPGYAPNPYDQTPRTEKIVIPSYCGSMLIGKAGSVIKNIKAQSGTQISLAKPDPSAPGDQVVSITGPVQGIQAAIYLIRQRVDSYQPPPDQAQQQYAAYA